MENFSLNKINQLIVTAPMDAKAYLTKYFVPLSNGDHAMLINGKYEVKDDNEVKKTYFNRMSSDLTKYYFKEYTSIKTVTYKLNAPIFYDDKINLCPKMMHEYKPYNSFSDDIKKNVNIVLKFIKEIMCSYHEDSYSFCLKWIANMLKGNKNNSCLYLKSPIQGLGKSTIPTFIKKHVIGKDLALETGSEPIKSRFNTILAGKLLVVLEELENFNVSEWQTVSTVLKRLITSDTINIQGKGQDAYETENINNYILISNNDAIKDDEGRRYFILDLCSEFVGEEEYFNNIYNNCFNDEVGHAFYCYMMEVDTNNFNSQKYPMTDNKKDSISKRLDSTYHFLKDVYVLKQKNILSSVGDLHEEYKAFCNNNDHRPHGKIDFNKKMKDININYFKSGTNGKENRYKISSEDLLNIAKKFKWIHDLDIFKDENNDETFDDTDYKSMFNELSKQYEELKAKFDALQNKKYESLNVTVAKPKVIKKIVKKVAKKTSPLDHGIVEDDKAIDDFVNEF